MLENSSDLPVDVTHPLNVVAMVLYYTFFAPCRHRSKPIRPEFFIRGPRPRQCDGFMHHSEMGGRNRCLMVGMSSDIIGVELAPPKAEKPQLDELV